MAGTRGAANGGRKGSSVAGAAEAIESVLTAAVRRTLKAKVLELRHLLEARRGPGQSVEGDFRRQLAAVGIDEQRIHPLAAGQTLNDEQRRVREIAVAVIEHEQQNGSTPAEAYAYFLRESAYTFLNRIIGLRCLEARGHLVVNGQTETAIWQKDELGGVPSLYWRLKNTLPPTTPPRELWREIYRRACEAISLDISILFDPQSEFAALFPLLPTMQQIVAAFNDPTIPPEAYAEDALLGWVYQYFQSEEKDQIFEAVRTKRKKIAGADIIPVTQLYTERYMVDFLLQNSLGRTWMEMYPDSEAKSAWPYYVTPATLHTRSPKPLKEWAILDPCVGSGHFLVVAFDLLVQLYAEERQFAEMGCIPWEWAVPEEEVAHTILEQNLYGIDIDSRAVQLAMLALYLKGKEAGLSQAPRINLVAADASFLHGVAWQRFLVSLEREPSVRRVLEAMAGYLKDIRELGSLLQPEKELKRLIEEEHRKWEVQSKPQQDALFPEYQPPTQEVLAFEQISDEEFWERLASRAEAAIQAFLNTARIQGHIADQVVAGEAQRGFAFLELCQRRYDVVCTNPPYMGSGNMGSLLKDFIAKHYSTGKRDLYTSFILRTRELVCPDGYLAMVTQHGWMFLGSFAELRKDVISKSTLSTLAHLGPKTFKDLSNSNALGFALFVINNRQGASTDAIVCFRLVHEEMKEEPLRDSIKSLNQGHWGPAYLSYITALEIFEKMPEASFFYWAPRGIRSAFLVGRTLSHYVDARQGLITGDNDRFLRCFWEITQPRWTPYVKGGPFSRWFGNQELVVDWEGGGQEIKALKTPNGRQKSRPQNLGFFFREGGTWTGQSSYGFSVRYMPPGFIFSDKGPAFFAKSPNFGLPGLIALANSKVIQYVFSALQPTVDYHEGYFMNLPAPADEISHGPLSALGEVAINIKRRLCMMVFTERCFVLLASEGYRLSSLIESCQYAIDETLALQTMLHTLEGWNDQLVCSAYEIDENDIQIMLGETGTPVGWQPLISGYDSLPASLGSVLVSSQGLIDFLATHKRLIFSAAQIWAKKGRV